MNYQIAKNAKLLQKYIGLNFLGVVGANAKKFLTANGKLFAANGAICAVQLALLLPKKQNNPFHENEQEAQNRRVRL